MQLMATGEEHWRAGKKEEAIESLKQGIVLRPNYPPLHLVLAQWFWETDKPGMAKDECLRVLQFDPENSVAYRFLAKIYSHLSDEKSLAETNETILQLDPFDPEAQAYIEKNADQRIPFATIAIAELYESQGYWHEALAVYKELLSREPDNEIIKNKINTLSTTIGQ